MHPGSAPGYASSNHASGNRNRLYLIGLEPVLRRLASAAVDASEIVGVMHLRQGLNCSARRGRAVLNRFKAELRQKFAVECGVDEQGGHLVGREGVAAIHETLALA